MRPTWGENGTFEQIVTHLESEVEVKGLEAPDELQIKTVSHNTANKNADRPKPTCHAVKKPGYDRNQCRLLKEQKEKEQSGDTQNNPGNNNSSAINSIPHNNTNNNKKLQKQQQSREKVIKCLSTL